MLEGLTVISRTFFLIGGPPPARAQRAGDPSGRMVWILVLGVAGLLLAVPSLVALKVAARHKPSWSRVLDFLAPNEKWTPRSLEQLRRFGKRGAKTRGAPQSPPERGGLGAATAGLRMRPRRHILS